jgi:hypothetical protein
MRRFTPIIVSLCLLALCGSVHAQTFDPTPPPQARRAPSPGMWQKSLGGVVLGPWFTGDLGNEIATPEVRLHSSGTAFHIEFFYQPHLKGAFNLEMSVGAINRGDLRIQDDQISQFGDATIYPLSAGLAIRPLASKTSLRLQPCIQGGGSLVIGTERLQFAVQDIGVGIDSESRTALGYYFGGGLAWTLGPSFCLTSTVKYHHAKFNDELFGVKDYSGVLVLFGAAYMYR